MLHAVAHVVHQLCLAAEPFFTFCAPIPVFFLPLQCLDFLELFRVYVLNLLLHLLVLSVSGAIGAGASRALCTVRYTGVRRGGVWGGIRGGGATVTLFWSSVSVWVKVVIIIRRLREIREEWGHVWWDPLLRCFGCIKI